MLDVVHYLFEEDLVAASVEQAKARSQIRKSIYRDWYGADYKFAINDGTAGGAAGGTGTSVVPADGRAHADTSEFTHKPYIPPTDTEIGPDPTRPFKGLEAPLG
jgi:hypothetical protein